MKSIPGSTIWKDHESMSIAAVHFFVAACHQAIAKRGRFVVALSGGNTPQRLYQLLATPNFSRNIPWDIVFLFWSDERFVPHSHMDSNYRMVKQNLLDHISIPEKNIFPVPVNGTAKKSAKDYEATLQDFFKPKKVVFDLLLLGIGEDGHTASLFPGTAILKEKRRLVKEVCTETKKSWRISFTLPFINKAEQIIFLVSGKEKAVVVADILNHKKIKPALPAQLVKPVKANVYWILDGDAAAKI